MDSKLGRSRFDFTNALCRVMSLTLLTTTLFISPSTILFALYECLEAYFNRNVVGITATTTTTTMIMMMMTTMLIMMILTVVVADDVCYNCVLEMFLGKFVNK